METCLKYYPPQKRGILCYADIADKISRDILKDSMDFPSKVEELINDLVHNKHLIRDVVMIVSNTAGYSQQYAVLLIYKLIRLGLLTDDNIKKERKFIERLKDDRYEYILELYRGVDKIREGNIQIGFNALKKTYYGLLQVTYTGTEYWLDVSGETIPFWKRALK